MRSRPRSLAILKSVGLTDKVREIIEQGPPEELIATFHKLFDEKIKDTKALAVQAAKRYNFPAWKNLSKSQATQRGAEKRENSCWSELASPAKIAKCRSLTRYPTGDEIPAYSQSP